MFLNLYSLLYTWGLPIFFSSGHHQETGIGKRVGYEGWFQPGRPPPVAARPLRFGKQALPTRQRATAGAAERFAHLLPFGFNHQGPPGLLILRRQAIEPIIGHLKADGRLGRNFLKGAQGDRLHVLLSGAGHNLRLTLNRLRLFWLENGTRPGTWRRRNTTRGLSWLPATSMAA